MKIVQPTQLRAKNFGPYKELKFDFIKGVHLVVGNNKASTTETDNGSGKTSLVEAIQYCITGKIKKSNDPSFHYQGDCSVELDFHSGDDNYKIIRTFKDKKRKSSLSFYLNEQDITSRIKTETQEVIYQAVGLPEEILSRFVFMDSGSFSTSNLTGTQRKLIIEDLIGTSWDALKKKVVSINREANNTIEDLTSKINSAQMSMTQVETEISQIEIWNQHVKTTATKQKDDIQKSLDSETKKYQEFPKKEAYNTEPLNALNNQRSQAYHKYISMKESIDNSFCSLCKRPFEVKNLPSNEDLNKLALEIQVLDIRITKENQQYQEVVANHNSLNQLHQSIEQLKSQFESVKVDLLPENPELTNKLKAVQETIESSSADKIYWKERLDHCTYLLELFQPSSKFRSYVVSRYLDIINKELLTLSDSLLQGSKIRLSIDSRSKGVDLLITRDSKTRTVNSFSQGEKSKIDLALTLAIQKIHLEFFHTRFNSIFLDEVFGAIDASGVSGLMDNLPHVYPEDSSIYIISHNTKLKNHVNSYIEVTKENDPKGLHYSVLDASNYKGTL